MRATFEVEMIQDHGGAKVLRVITGYGDPVLTVATENVILEEPKVVMGSFCGSDPT